jgi:FAD-linked oxidoreductase
MTANWVNWAGNQSARCETVHPRGTGEIIAAVEAAATSGRHLRPIGSGHSPSAIARPEDVQLVLDRHDDLVRVNTVTGLVTVQAGMTLYRLNELLAGVGLGLTNLGDIDAQTVAGAISTGTHGTGARFGGLATQVRGLELVTAAGAVLTCSATENPEIYDLARIGLGALGVVSAVTLQAEPAFALRAEESVLALAEVMDRFDEFADESDHFEFYWFPHTKRTQVKRNTRLPIEDNLAPLRPWQAWWVDDFLSNTVFGTTLALGRLVPPLVRPINRISARALGDRTYTDRSDKVFTADRRVRFLEMEYAVPRSAAVDVLADVRRVLAASSWRVGFPIEVRVGAADDIPLSMANGRQTAYLAIQAPVGVDLSSYFATMERIMVEYDGRPHWGKIHHLEADDLRDRYPQFDDFVRLRDRLDPTGMFGNEYLEQVLGPVSRTWNPATRANLDVR